MSRTTIYNRNYPGKAIDKGTMLTMDGQKLVLQYLYKAQTISLADDRFTSPDSFHTARYEMIYLLTMCMDHFIRVSKTTDVEYIRNLVNSYMADHERGNREALKLITTFMFDVLHHADRYRGFNNYKWSNGGSNAHYADGNDPTTSNDPKYTSQEYHRIFY